MLGAVPPQPVHEGDFPDPFVLAAGGRYYAYGTQTGGMNLQVMASADLARWEHRGDPLPELPGWAAPGLTWAPAVLARDDGTFVLYYTVHVRGAGRQAISVATAGEPGGPFVDRSSGPLVFQASRGGSIDPSPFVDADGTAYLLWKSDDNAIGGNAGLWGAPLRPDRLGLDGEPVQILRHDAPWEKPLVEGPSLAHPAGGPYVLFYSGGWWEGDGYGVGYATGPAPLGPFAKATTAAPWLATAPGMAGPGGAEAFADADGGWRLAFHAWTPPLVGYDHGGARALWIERLSFAGGRPELG
jgi:beta-xylosidase